VSQPSLAAKTSSSGLPDGILSKQKSQVNFGGRPWNGKGWYVFGPFGIFITAIWYIYGRLLI
jgi:hypothetical protein